MGQVSEARLATPGGPIEDRNQFIAVRGAGGVLLLLPWVSGYM